LRIYKSDAEIANMRKAGQASGRAFTSAMSRGFSKEKDLQAFLEYQFKMNGCDSSAFVPVVGGGRVCLGFFLDDVRDC
jgi:intermediate cleaving peptidase 55